LEKESFGKQEQQQPASGEAVEFYLTFNNNNNIITIIPFFHEIFN